MGYRQACTAWPSAWCVTGPSDLTSFPLSTCANANRWPIYIDAHGHDAVASHSAHGPESEVPDKQKSDEHSSLDEEAQLPRHVLDSVLTQCIGIGILEFGVVLHR